MADREGSTFTPGDYWEREVDELVEKGTWAWDQDTTPIPQICKDLEWFDHWRAKRAGMGLDNEVPDRLLAYLRVHLHNRINDER